MRIAVFSDIHANLAAMQAVRTDIERGGFDHVVCLGDIGGYASQPNETQSEIMAMGCPVVMGNYDESVGSDLEDCGCHYVKDFDIKMSTISFRWTRDNTSSENKAWLRSLPRDIRMEVEGQRILFCHGSPRSTTEYLFLERSDGFLRQFVAGGKDDAAADMIMFGHTHVPFHREVDGAHFVNVGSVGRPKDGDPRAGYCALTILPDRVETEQIRVEYDVEQTARRLVEAGLPEFFADYLRSGGSAVKS